MSLLYLSWLQNAGVQEKLHNVLTTDHMSSSMKLYALQGTINTDQGLKSLFLINAWCLWENLYIHHLPWFV